MHSALLYVGIAMLAVLFRFGLGLTQGCLYVGKVISDSGSKTGYQDAVTPPFSTKFMLALYVLIPATFIFAFWYFGAVAGVIAMVEFVFVTVLTGVLLPKSDAAFWVRTIYASLARRSANYAKKNDHMRSEAARSLATLIEERLGAKLVER